MKPYEMAALAAIAILLILLIYFATAKGERKRIILINGAGEQIGVDVEIAATPGTQAKGLMGRKTLGENEGMLFVFYKSGRYSFWMLNTTIPLDAVFIDEKGTVVDIIGMEPCGFNIAKCGFYTPKAPARYVLEANLGFSEKNKIVPGNSSILLESIER